MDAPLDIDRLLALRRLTRALEDVVRTHVRDHLTTVAPLLRPRTVLGDFVQGPGKEAARGADRVWKEVQALYDAVAPKAPFSLARDLKAPLDIPGTAVEMAPVEYRHTAERGGERKQISVTRPFEWVLSYSAHGPVRLRELVADKNRDAVELQRVIALAIVLHLVIERQAGVSALFAGLRLPLETRRVSEFGQLPVTVLVSMVPTFRPPDAVLIESTDMTGTGAFQEVVDVEALSGLSDPFHARLLEVVRQHQEGAAR
jgi:hypothetical protein